jgi:hypothetical protein
LKAGRQLGTGGDDQVVVGQAGAVGQFQRIALGVDALHGLGHELDALLLEVRADRECDGLALAPAHGQPRVGGHELEIVDGVDDGDAMRAVQQCAQFIGCGHAADAGAEDDGVCHGSLLDAACAAVGV